MINGITPVVDSFLVEIAVCREDINVVSKFEGCVETRNGIQTTVVKVPKKKLSLEDFLDLQGRVLEKGTVIHGNYKAPFRCRVDRVIESDKNFEFELIDYSDLFITFDLPQEYLKHVSLGMLLPFESNKTQYDSVITYISQYITDGTVQIEMSIDNAELLIYSNVSISLVTEKYEDVVVVPQYAVTKTATGQQYVTIRENDGEKKLIEVVCGRTINDDIIVESGLTGGETLLVDASSIKNS